MGQNPIPLVNIKIAGKWMFIPLKMVLIGIDPYPYMIYVTVLLCRHDATRSDPFLIISTCWKGTPAVSPQWCPLANAKWPAMTGKWHGRHKPVWHGMTLGKYYEYTWSTIESEPSNTIFRNLGKKTCKWLPLWTNSSLWSHCLAKESACHGVPGVLGIILRF